MTSSVGFQYVNESENGTSDFNITDIDEDFGLGNRVCNVVSHEIHPSAINLELSLWIWKIVSMILIVIGTVGNIITIIVLLRQKLRRVSSTMYLLALAINDLLVLHFGLLRHWIWKTHKLDVRPHLHCGFHVWLVYTTVAYSSWILVALTIERVVSVKFPVYAKNGFSRKSAVIVLTALFVTIAVINSHMLFSWENREYSVFSISTNATTPLLVCEPTSESFKHLHIIWPWVDLCLVSIVPLTLLVLGNCFIGQNLIVRARSRRQQHLNGNGRNGTCQLRQQKSATKLLALLSVVFFINTLPVSIYLVTASFYKTNTDPNIRSKFALWWAIASMFMYANNAMNFILYCVSGTNFRYELKKMMREIRQWGHKQITRPCISRRENHALKSFVDGIQATFRRKHNTVAIETSFKDPSVSEATSSNGGDHNSEDSDRIFSMFVNNEFQQQLSNNSRKKAC